MLRKLLEITYGMIINGASRAAVSVLDSDILTPKEIYKPLYRKFENPWDGLYLPLFYQLQQSGFSPGQSDWCTQTEMILQKEAIWFDGDKFQVGINKKINPLDSFYDLVSLSLSCGEYLKIQTIFNLLIKPYHKLIPIEVYLPEYRKIQQQIFHYYNLIHPSRRIDYTDSKYENEQSVIKIQRAFRLHQYHKAKDSQKMQEKIQYLSKFDPKTPEKSNPLDEKAAIEWIQHHPKELQASATKVIKSLKHHSFKDFLLKLQHSVNFFNEKLMSLPPEKRQYIIVLPNKHSGKSNFWVTNLALKYFAVPAFAIVEDTHLKEFKQANPDITIAVFLDDAAYSGKQMRNIIMSLPYSCHVIIPFMTRVAAQVLTSYGAWIAEHERMLSVEELKAFDEDELKLLRKGTSSYDHGVLSHRCLTWFDHHIPDHLSTVEIVEYRGKWLLDGNWFYAPENPDFELFHQNPKPY